MSVSVPFRRRMLNGLQSALYWSGAASMYVRVRRVRGAVILMYHSVSGSESARWIDPRNRIAPELFEAQMRFLNRGRYVTAIGALVEALRKGEHLRAGSVVLTFDDGYRDTLEVVAPILERFGFPATLYLSTGYVGRGQAQWADCLYSIFAHRTCHELDLHERGLQPCDLRDAGSCELALRHVAGQLLVSSYADRERLLAEVAAQLCPIGQAPRLTLTWNEVRDLVRRYPLFDIGAHTADHIDLTASAAETVRQELQTCIADIERELGRRPEHFSFPYSRSDEPTRERVKQAGFQSAVCAGRHPLIDARADAFALPRIDVPRSMTLFRFRTSGAYPGLPLALLGRA